MINKRKININIKFGSGFGEYMCKSDTESSDVLEVDNFHSEYSDWQNNCFLTMIN